MTRRKPPVRGRRRNRIPIALLPRPGQDLTVHDPVFAQRRPGRPALMPEEALQRFLTALRTGNTRKDAAIYAGLTDQSVKNWLWRGRGHDKSRPPTPEYVRFARMVEEAEVTAKILVTGNLVARARHDTGAALAWLQTRYPEDWPRNPMPLEPGDPGATAAVVIDNRDQRQQVVLLDASEYPELVARILAQRREARAIAEPTIPIAEEAAPRGTRHPRLDALRVETDDRPT